MKPKKHHLYGIYKAGKLEYSFGPLPRWLSFFDTNKDGIADGWEQMVNQDKRYEIRSLQDGKVLYTSTGVPKSTANISSEIPLVKNVHSLLSESFGFTTSTQKGQSQSSIDLGIFTPPAPLKDVPSRNKNTTTYTEQPVVQNPKPLLGGNTHQPGSFSAGTPAGSTSAFGAGDIFRVVLLIGGLVFLASVFL